MGSIMICGTPKGTSYQRISRPLVQKHVENQAAVRKREGKRMRRRKRKRKAKMSKEEERKRKRKKKIGLEWTVVLVYSPIFSTAMTCGYLLDR
jgi:hypothetical protein